MYVEFSQQIKTASSFWLLAPSTTLSFRAACSRAQRGEGASRNLLFRFKIASILMFAWLAGTLNADC